MYRKWKGVSALIMAVLIGGFMPMSTLMADGRKSGSGKHADPGKHCGTCDRYQVAGAGLELWSGR